MKSRISSMVLLLCLLFGVIGCEGPTPKEGLKDSGLFGEHPLLKMENFSAVQGSVSGSFFIGCGSINGSLGSEFKMQFYWVPKPGEIVATSLPYSKFRFVIDETKNTPTVEFKFHSCWLNKSSFTLGEQTFSSNLNDHIISKNLELVIVKISSSTMEKEVYLPKVNNQIN